MLKPVAPRESDDFAAFRWLLRRSARRRVLRQSQVWAILVIVVDVARKKLAEMILTQDDDMVEKLATD